MPSPTTPISTAHDPRTGPAASEALPLELLADRSQLIQTAKLAEIGMAMAELVHQLRQPLCGISGYAQLIASDPRARDTEDWSRELLAQSARLEQMLERMRRFLKPGEDEPLEPVDVGAVLKEAIDILPRMPPGVGVEYRAAADLPCARARANELVQVFGNLLANARDALAGGPPGQLRIEAELQGDRLRILFADDGAGIPPEIRSRLFTPFATSKGDQGTGLGLYVCRELLAGFGAELRLLDPPPAPFTTVFEILLPVFVPAPAPGEPTTEAGEVPAEALAAVEALVGEVQARIAGIPASRRVLLVDGNPAQRRALRVLLAAEPGLEILDAADGMQALELLARAPAHLIVSALELPGMGGLELLRQARERQPIEAMIVTGHPSPRSVIEGLGAGARDFFSMPLASADELRARARAALARQRPRQLVHDLGPALRDWAQRMLGVLPAEGTVPLRSCLEALCERPEGVPTLAVIGTRRDVELTAESGNRPQGPFEPGQLATVLASGKIEVLLLGQLARDQALELVRGAAASPRAPAIAWTGPVGGFDEALMLMKAGIAAAAPEPLDARGVALAIAQATRTHREQRRATALDQAMRGLGIDPEGR